MKKFEYKSVNVRELDKKYYGELDIGKINELGREGWELIMVNGGKYIFKREL